jgi:Ca-activated chloride channel family protein
MAILLTTAWLVHGVAGPSGGAQQGRLTVTGTVVSQSGAAVASASVQLIRDGRPAYSTTTNDRGEFTFTRIAPGSYVVRVTRTGFATLTMLPIQVAEGRSAPLRLVLRPDSSGPRREQVLDAPAIGAAAAPAVKAEGLMIADRRAMTPPPFNTEAYSHIVDNAFKRVTVDPVSTFSIDVDTASYSNVRRFLNEGRLPPEDAVRTEELVNYFRFAYPAPSGDAPVSVTTELAPCPWNPKHRLALVGLSARAIEAERTPPRNLVFLLDVSGSMMPANKIPLVRTAMRMLANTLRAEDRVAIVVYAGASGLVLPPTPGDRREDIVSAIERLEAGGSTNGAAGIRLAYDTAAANFARGGINRVILATDGDFNVGVTSEGELVRLIEEQRARGVFLSVLGVGTGNLKDSMMEKLAGKGNGNYAYLDSVQEARRVLVAEAGATLVTVAKDVKVQVEFNPARVAGYRLIGYENRLLNREDFKDDRKDAGEMGAGHTVTALYEIVPPGEAVPGGDVEPLRYQSESRPNGDPSGEVMHVRVRYKKPDGDTSRELTFPVADGSAQLRPNSGFAAAVAQFGMLLRRSEFKGRATWSTTLDLARRFRGDDPDGYRAEFIRLVELAAALDRPTDEPSPRR